MLSSAVLLAALLAAAGAAGSTAGAADPVRAGSVAGTADAAAEEVARIRAHLSAVEAELRAADVTHLTMAQRAARAHHIEVLRGYREAGVFPHNHVVPDRRVPVFVDEHGTHCAVGYLLMRDGRQALVARISGDRNLAAVPELADEPELIAWLEAAGLSVAEAARIQPMYGPDPWPLQEPAGSGAYVAASLIGTGLGGGMIAWNALRQHDEPGRLPGWLGIGVGAADITLAAIGAHLDRQPDRQVDAAHVMVNLGVGVLSGLMGARTLALADRADRPASAALRREAAARPEPQWQVAPWAPAQDGGAGVRVGVRF